MRAAGVCGATPVTAVHSSSSAHFDLCNCVCADTTDTFASGLILFLAPPAPPLVAPQAKLARAVSSLGVTRPLLSENETILDRQSIKSRF